MDIWSLFVGYVLICFCILFWNGCSIYWTTVGGIGGSCVYHCIFFKEKRTRLEKTLTGRRHNSSFLTTQKFLLMFDGRKWQHKLDSLLQFSSALFIHYAAAANARKIPEIQTEIPIQYLFWRSASQKGTPQIKHQYFCYVSFTMNISF